MGTSGQVEASQRSTQKTLLQCHYSLKFVEASDASKFTEIPATATLLQCLAVKSNFQHAQRFSTLRSD